MDSAANQAIAINSKLQYCRARDQNGVVFVLAKDCLRNLRETFQLDLEMISCIEPSELLLSKYMSPINKAIKRPILDATFVDKSMGTGLVHIAPSYGHEDFDLCEKHQIVPMSIIDDSGCFIADEPLRGLSFYSQDGENAILDLLRKNRCLVASQKITLRHPIDWRTKKPVIIRATKQWFIDISKISLKLHSAIDSIKFSPSNGKNKLHQMIASRNSWCISRQRIWGVPIPVFYKKSDDSSLLDPHIIRDFAEKVRNEGTTVWWKSSESELLPTDYSPKDYVKSYETLDVWFDSGTAWSTMAPHQQAEVAIEGSDQFRGWFQSSLITSIASREVIPLKRIIIHGFVLDAAMRKMSKSLGNVIDPQDIISKYGLDVMRMWVAAVNYQDDISLSDKAFLAIKEQYLKLRNTFWFILGNLRDQRFKKEAQTLTEMDSFALSHTKAVLREVFDHYNDLEFSKGLQKLSHFVSHDLSAFYFLIIKDRLYLSRTSSTERLSALYVLHEIAIDLGRALAPVAPMLASEVSDILNIDLLRLSVDNSSLPVRSNQFEELYSFRKEVLLQSDDLLSFAKVIIPKAYLKKYTKETLWEVLQCAIVIFDDIESVQVVPTGMFKCQRCWHHRSSEIDNLCVQCQIHLCDYHV